MAATTRSVVIDKRAALTVWLYAGAACAVALAGASLLNRLASRAVSYLDAGRTHTLGDAQLLPVAFLRNVPSGWIVFGVLVVVLVAACACGLAACNAAYASQMNPRVVLIVQALVCLSLMACAFTISGDVFLFILWGRLYGVLGANPYLWSAPSLVKDAAVAQITSGYGLPLVPDDYGPLWTLLEGAISRAEANASVWFQVMSHRLLMIGCAIAASAGLLRIVRGLPKAQQINRLALFAFNPLMIYECAVEAHNDMLIVALGIWAFAVAETMPLVAALLLGAAIAVKFVPLVVAPFLAIKIARRHGLGTAVLGAAVAGAVLALSFRPFWFGPSLFASLGLRLVSVAGSPLWLVQTVWRWVGGRSPDLVLSAIALVGLVGVIVLLLRNFWVGQNRMQIWRALAAAIWFMPSLNPEVTLWLSPAIAAGNPVWRRYAWWLATFALGYYAVFLSRPPEAIGAPTALTLVFVLILMVVPVALTRAPSVLMTDRPNG